MNRQPKITRREQQDFIRDEAIKLLHFAVRVCPCNGVNCQTCHGSMKYFDDPVPIYGVPTTGMNSKKKEPELPSARISTYKLLVEARYRVAEGDRLTPFGMREFEMIDEVLPVSDPKLTFIPINPRGVSISFIGTDGVINYQYPKDFTIDRKLYGRIPLFSKEIKWQIDPPKDQEKFSVRYGYLPDFVVEEIPPARMSQGQLLIQELPLRKITLNQEEKEKSYEKSSDAIVGMKYI